MNRRDVIGGMIGCLAAPPILGFDALEAKPLTFKGVPIVFDNELPEPAATVYLVRSNFGPIKGDQPLGSVPGYARYMRCVATVSESGALAHTRLEHSTDGETWRSSEPWEVGAVVRHAR